jgi:drug/metabolite transporter (DMT)-like permease
MPKWLFYCSLTIVFWGIWGAIGKALGGLSASQSQALSTLGIVPIMMALAMSPNWRVGDRKLRGSLSAFVAGVLVCVGNIAYYQALAAGAKAATTVSLTAIYPITTVALAILLLGEKPNPVQLAGIAGSMVAIYLLNVGQASGFWSGGMAYVLAPILLWGGAALVMKLSTRDVSAELSTFWFLASFVPLGAAILAIGRPGWSLSARDWLLVTLLGATYGLGNLSLLAAYGHQGKASIVTPLSGLYPIVTVPLAITFFGEQVGVREWLGIALALAAGAALSFEPAAQEV